MVNIRLKFSLKNPTYIGLVKAFASPVELGGELRGDEDALVGNVGHHGRVNHHHDVKRFGGLVQPGELPSFDPPVELLFP